MNATGNALAVREPAGALAIQDGQVEWTTMQLAALGQLGIADAPDGDKQVFLHVSQRTGLDPFARQIYMIGRQEKKNVKQPNGQWIEVKTTKWGIQTGIEGWRVIRDRAEKRYGVRGIKSRFTYYAPDGNAFPVWVRRDPPVAIEMTYTVVEPGGREVPYTSILRFDEYKQSKTYTKDGQEVTVAIAQWAVKPVHMLEKCCEADAYRCAFPQDYSGVVLDDAMPWQDPDDAPAVQPERQRVTGDDLRARAEQARQQQPQRVTSTVVVDPAGEELPPPPDAPMGQQPQAPAQPAPAAGRNPRDGVIAQFDRLKIAAVAERLDYAARLLGIEPIGGLDVLTAAEAERLVPALARCGNREQLVEMLAAGTVAGGE